MSYYDDFDDEQRRDFESDPFITGVNDGSGFGSLGLLIIVIVIIIILII